MVNTRLKEKHIALPSLFFLATYATSITGSVLACFFWLELVPLARGTEVRPMGAALYSMVVGLATTVVSFIFVFFGLALGDRHKWWLWVLTGVAVLVAAAPLPITWYFFHWLMDARGLVPLR